jgi:very-short-patch-repair endonuclease
MKRFYNDQDSKTRRRLLRRNQTDAEQKLWQVLRNRQMDGLKFFRQYSVDNYILDLYCPAIKLAVEVDGGQHLDSDDDIKRTNDLCQESITVLRFWNTDVLINPDGVYEKIYSAIKMMKS